MLFFIISSMVLVIIGTVEIIIMWDGRNRNKITWSFVYVWLPLVIAGQWAIFYIHSCVFLNF